MDALCTELTPLLERVDKSIPIVLRGVDNSCFRGLTTGGDLVKISRDPVDKLFHVNGDLVVTPFSLLKSVIREVKHFLALCGDREVWIADVLLRLLIIQCCDHVAHCAKVRLPGADGVAAGKQILTDLRELNALFAAHFTSPTVRMVSTG